MPTTAIEPTVVEWPDGAVWVIGGSLTRVSTGTAVTSNTIYEFVPGTGEWFDTGIQLPAAVNAPAIAVLNSTTLVVVGGATSGTATPTAGVWTLDRKSRTWTARTSYPITVYAPNWVVTAEGHFRVIGGYSSTGGENNVKVYELDPDTWDWTAKNDCPAIPTFYRGQCKLNDGRLALIGGYHAGIFATVHIYDPAGNGNLGSFGAVSDLPAVKRWPTCSTREYNGSVYVFGGEDATNAGTTTVFKVSTTAGTSATTTALTTAIFGGPACWTNSVGKTYLFGSTTPANKLVQIYQQT